MKITGLNELTRTLEQAQKALADLDGKLCSVQINPHDPASIEAAIQHANAMMDEKVGAYANNPLVAPLIQASKQKFRETVIAKASAARLKSGNGDEQQG